MSSTAEPRSATRPAAAGLTRYLSPNPSRRATERFWLWYTPVWGGLSALVMVGGLAERWGDAELLAFGLVVASGALAGPLVWRAPEDRGRPLLQSTAFKMGLSVLLFAFGLNYSMTPYFYDVLHMHYGFATELNIRNVPFFLYLVTCAYFATYCVLIGICFRFARARLGRRWRWLGWIVAPIVVAFLETALNANPFMASLFCYDDMSLVLGFGTLSYGMALLAALPVWMAIDERPGSPRHVTYIIVGAAAALYVTVLGLDVLRYHVAPHLTTVVEGANGLRDFAGSCLVMSGR